MRVLILHVLVLNFKSSDVATREVPLGCTEPEGNASEDGLLNSLAIQIPISRGASGCVW